MNITDATSPYPELENGLKIFLADTYQLMALSHLAHWNVQGSDFFALHNIFEEHYTDLFNAADDIAERMRALYLKSPGGLAQLAEISGVSEFDSTETNPKELVKALIEGHEVLLSNAKSLRDKAGEVGDAQTEDMVIARIQQHQKVVWMLRAYLG